jgi:hypothetical protein
MRQVFCRTLAAAVMLSAAFTVGACHHHRHDRGDGPVERAGSHVDHAADRAGDVVEDAGRKVNRALPGD